MADSSKYPQLSTSVQRGGRTLQLGASCDMAPAMGPWVTWCSLSLLKCKMGTIILRLLRGSAEMNLKAFYRLWKSFKILVSFAHESMSQALNYFCPLLSKMGKSGQLGRTFWQKDTRHSKQEC